MPNKKEIDIVAQQKLEPEVPALPVTADTPDATPSSALLDNFKRKNVPTAPELPPMLRKQVSTFDKKQLTKTTAAVTPPAPQQPVPVEEKELQPDPIPEAKLDDSISDAVVDEISVQDSDELLLVEDTVGAPPRATLHSSGGLAGFFRRKLTWLGIVLIILIALFAVPFTRYKILGLVIKQSFTVTVTDSKTDTAVSYATLSLDGKQIKTDAAGNASITVPVGYGTLDITKQYYESQTERVGIGLFKQSKPLAIALLATGRQVPVTVSNEITGAPLADATVTVLDTTAKTNSKGQATIVLPTKAQTYPVSISADDYNGARSTVTVTSSVISGNQFKLVPSGKVYFLSNASGKVDVDSTNLDGTDTQVVLAGTGNESTQNTQLSNSSDWKYLMLDTQRSSTAGSMGLYLINTQNNNDMTTVDSGTDNFTPVGWSGHYFIYEVQDPTVASNLPDQYELKSYDADTNHSTTLDQSNGIGTSSTDSESQQFGNFYLINGKLIYTKLWQGNDPSASYIGSNTYTSSIDTIDVDGENQAPLQQFAFNSNDSSDVVYLQANMYAPNSIYYEINQMDGSTQFYGYTNGTVALVTTLSQAQFSTINYSPGVASPSGATALFTTTRNGQSVFLTGDPSSTTSAQHTIATLSSDYSFYGWYTDNYIILSYKGDELYIMPASGLSGSQQPFKITRYL